MCVTDFQRIPELDAHIPLYEHQIVRDCTPHDFEPEKAIASLADCVRGSANEHHLINWSNALIVSRTMSVQRHRDKYRRSSLSVLKLWPSPAHPLDHPSGSSN